MNDTSWSHPLVVRATRAGAASNAGLSQRRTKRRHARLTRRARRLLGLHLRRCVRKANLDSLLCITLAVSSLLHAWKRSSMFLLSVLAWGQRNASHVAEIWRARQRAAPRWRRAALR
jgi:hypothetical protein